MKKPHVLSMFNMCHLMSFVIICLCSLFMFVLCILDEYLLGVMLSPEFRDVQRQVPLRYCPSTPPLEPKVAWVPQPCTPPLSAEDGCWKWTCDACNIGLVWFGSATCSTNACASISTLEINQSTTQDRLFSRSGEENMDVVSESEIDPKVESLVSTSMSSVFYCFFASQFAARFFLELWGLVSAFCGERPIFDA